MFDKLIHNVEPENDIERDTMAETMKAMWKVLGTWHDMDKMGQTVKIDYQAFEIAISKRMWEGD